MSAIVWQDPPPPKPAPMSRWRRIADELRAHPLRWALVGEYDTAKRAQDAASLVRVGARSGMDEGEFDAVVATTEDGHELYVRYVGGA